MFDRRFDRRIALMLTSGLAQAAFRAADAHGMTLSEYTRQALRSRLRSESSAMAEPSAMAELRGRNKGAGVLPARPSRRRAQKQQDYPPFSTR